MPEFVVLGGGPTGLGAAWRLHSQGADDWVLLEKTPQVGGLSASETDEHGFVWDMGGHVLFSHYDYFDRLMNEWLGDRWVDHERESWVWIADRFVPYPFQNNIRHLPHDRMWQCLRGMIQLYKNPPKTPPAQFRDWIFQHFGEGIADLFMIPYNMKVWAYPPEDLEFNWVGERVARVDLERVIDNLLHGKDDISWGPNNTFRFPLHGGTGSIWNAALERLPREKVHLDAEVVVVDPVKKFVRTAKGDEFPYKHLISTMPLTHLTERAGLTREAEKAARLRYSGTHVVGLGMEGRPPEALTTKCWMYFPESNNPFYRVTVFSNYSPNNVPDISRQWSLMCEVSESPKKPVDPRRVVEDCIEGCLATKLIPNRDAIRSTFARHLPVSYPTPALGRTEALDGILARLMQFGLYSRGRFGAWKYEVGNQDHCFAQGVEAVNHLLHGVDETTVWFPNVANGKKPWKV